MHQERFGPPLTHPGRPTKKLAPGPLTVPVDLASPQAAWEATTGRARCRAAVLKMLVFRTFRGVTCLTWQGVTGSIPVDAHHPWLLRKRSPQATLRGLSREG